MPPGTRLGRYEIIGELGTGGMATVYEGRALSVGGFARRVAIKYLHPHLLRDEQFVQMFMDEGRLAAGIHHPNVVAVVDLVLEAQCMYMVSEFVEGDQLLALFKAARDAKTRIPAPIAVRIALDMLAGLHAAHELVGDDGTPLRIVHRDVSPHNVLVGADGITRITDFGIAKAEERISTTRDGIVKGKLSYMAPEQPDDMPVDRRADLFSAATVLWECLTSRRLFPGRSDREVLEALLRKPIPTLREVVPELPAELDEVLMKALARNPDERFDTAAEFAEALEVGARGVGVATPREVARYVELKSASKLGAERQRRRAMTTKELPVYRPSAAPDAPAVAPATASPAPSTTSVRTEPGLGPPRDPDDQPTMLSAPHAIKNIRGGSPLPVDEFEDPTIVKPGATPKPLPAVIPSPTASVAAPSTAPAAPIAAVAALAPPVVLKAPTAPPAPARPSQAPPPRSARGLALALLVISLGAALGYGIWIVLRPTAPVETAVRLAPATNTSTAALETSPAIAAPPPVTPIVELPSPHVAPPPLEAPAPPHVAPPPLAPPTAERATPDEVALRPAVPAAPAAPRVAPRPRVTTTPATTPRVTPETPAASPVAPTAPTAPGPPAVPSGPRLPRHI